MLFAPCGKVMKIDIRCCSGIVVPSGANANTVYATVLFASVEGATQALFMDGSPLLDKRIVVCSRVMCKGCCLSLSCHLSRRSLQTFSPCQRPIEAFVGGPFQSVEST